MKLGRSSLLAAALVALLVVIGVATSAVARSARTAQGRILALNHARMQSDDVLDDIRSNVYLIGILTRDYLLDTDPADVNQFLTQFNSLRSQTEKSLLTLALDVDSPRDSLD